MDVVHARYRGLDIHTKSVVAGALIARDDGAVRRKTRTFKTMAADPLALRDRLDRLGVTHVAINRPRRYRPRLRSFAVDGAVAAGA